MTHETAAGLWSGLLRDRDPYENRAEDAASLTIPRAFPRRGDNASTRFRTPFQSVGARGVRNLSSKIILSQLPPNSPFFRFVINPAEFAAEFGAELIAQAEQTLVKMELSIQAEMETFGLRPTAFELFEHLQLTGNGILEVPDEDRARFWPLRSYVLVRSGNDDIQTLLLREAIAGNRLPDAAKRIIVAAHGGEEALGRDHTVFRRIHRRPDGRFRGWQELGNGSQIPGTMGTWDEDQFPYLVQRWAKQTGESYGRSFIGDELMGDLRSLEGLTQAVVQGAGAAAHHLWFVNPTGVTRLKDVAGAPTGAFVSGVISDVEALQMNKQADFAFAGSTVGDITRSLREAFLLLTPVRNAERVTATEIFQISQELQETLGGVFSSFTEDFQLPLLRRVQARLQRRGALPELPPRVVEAKVVTGLEGLARNQELVRLRQGASDLQQILGPEAFANTIVPQELARRFWNGHGVNTDGLVRTDEEIAQQNQAQQLQHNVDNLGPEVIRRVSEAIQTEE